MQQPQALVSITGSFGVGKTALASSVAQAVAPQFPDGVIWLDTQDAHEASTVLRDLANHSGFGTKRRPTLDRLAEYLTDQRILVVVDNLEHVLDLRRDLAILHRTCSNLAILVVSRRLPGMGEQRIDLGPLPRGDAITLFCQRSGRNPAEVMADQHARRLINDICRLADDLPLAIELAAAKALTFELQVLANLVRDYPLAVLSGGDLSQPERLRSIGGAIAWSYEPLPDDAKYVMRHLSVFEPAATFQALARVTGFDPGRLSDVLNQLIEHGLVSFAGGNYQMLQLTHQFCLAELADRGEETAARDRHAAYFVQFAIDSLLGTNIHDETGKMRRPQLVEAEQANIDAAFFHLLVTGQVRQALELATSLRFSWWKSNRAAEGVLALDLALTQMPEEPSLLVAQAWTTHAFLSALLGVRDAAVASNRLAVEHLSRIGAIDPHDAVELATLAAVCEAYVATAEGAYPRERIRFLEALETMNELPELSERHFFLEIRNRVSLRLARLALILTKEPGAQAYDEAGQARGRLLDSLRYLEAGDALQAIQAAQDALRTAAAEQHHPAVYQAISAAAAIGAFSNQWETAARLAGAADHWAGETVPTSHRRFSDAAAMEQKRWDQATVDELGHDRSHLLWEEGYAMQSLERVSEALGELASSIREAIVQQGAQANPLGLTPRPQDVARLIARGRSNRQIADELFIDPDTVKTHRRVVRRAVREHLGLDASAELDDRRLVETLRQLYGTQP